jgi:hypothetical protein
VSVIQADPRTGSPPCRSEGIARSRLPCVPQSDVRHRTDEPHLPLWQIFGREREGDGGRAGSIGSRTTGIGWRLPPASPHVEALWHSAFGSRS